MNTSILKKIAITFAGLGVLAAGVAAYVFFIRLGYLEPEPRRNMASAHVRESVDVYRDSYGVPHIYGNSTEDVMFALGYTMAEDRLFQIEMMRRASSGELAAAFGSRLVRYDKYSRLGAYTKDELSSMLDGMPPPDRRAFVTMVEGINHYVHEAIDNPDDKLPVEFGSMGIELKPFTPTDVLAAISTILRKFGSSGGTELTNQSFLQAMSERYGEDGAQVIFDDILPLTDPDAYAIALDQEQAPVFNAGQADLQLDQYLSPEALNDALALQSRETEMADVLSSVGLSRGASRTIVIGPERSATGNPLILQGTADGSEVHLSSPEFEFAGLAIAPMGLPTQGRNLTAGTVITTGERDTIDIFAVQTHPEDKYKYLYKGEWLQMDVRRETIEVKDGESITYEIARTVHGPVVMRDEAMNKAYAKRWAMWMEEANIWASVLGNLKSDSAEDYAERLDQGFASNTNISYADIDGNFGFKHTGNLPIRALDVDPRLPANGDGSEDWTGMHAHSEHPGLSNPDKGYIHAWNNNPATGTVYGDGARWGKHFRTHLPLELIESRDKISLEDLKEFNRVISASYYTVDLTLTSPKFFAAYFSEAAAATDNPRVAEAAKLMLDWDGLFTDADKDGYYDHPGQILFRAWLPIALETVFDDDIDDWWQKLDYDHYIPYQTSLLLRTLEGDDAGVPMQWDYFNGEARVDVIVKSIVATLDKVSESHTDADPTRWQEPVYWRYLTNDDARRGDKPLFGRRRSTAYSGGATMLRYLPKAMLDNGAPEWLAMMEISADKPYYYSAIPSGGQSWFINTGWKASPHINDQYELHNALEFKKVHLDKDTIVDTNESQLTIRPSQ